MKLFSCVIMLLVASFSWAHEVVTLSDSIHCEEEGITVVGNVEKNTLDIKLPTGVFYSLPINQVIPMSPVYSVEARQNNHPVGGPLIEAKLSIQLAGPQKDAGLLNLVVLPQEGISSITAEYGLTCKITEGTY